jgi:hypothetical protein
VPLPISEKEHVTGPRRLQLRAHLPLSCGLVGESGQPVYWGLLPVSGHQAQAASNGTESTVSRISFLTVISNPGSLHPLTLSSRGIRQA